MQSQKHKLKVQNLKFLVFSFSFALYALRFAFICSAQEIKHPNVAGTFYPQDPQELSQTIDKFLDMAEPEPIVGDIIALILPHAGYSFSGPTAAYGYKLIKGQPYKTVVVIGSSHYYAFEGVSVYSEGIFRTPLGDLEIDSEFAKRLLNQEAKIFFEPKAFQKEHCIEVQLPFLQKVLSDFKIVPIIMSDGDFLTCKNLASSLRQVIGNSADVLIIASSDMYHSYDYEQAEIVDNLTLSYLAQMNPQVLYRKLKNGNIQLCGGLAVVTTMLAAKDLGHDKLKVLKYTNSSFVTGRKIQGDWTVGYTSCVIDTEEAGMLSQNQRKRLLEIARASIERHLNTGENLEVSESDPILNKEMGAFVTLHESGQLRGCIGNLIGSGPLYLVVRDMAVEAAVDDPRFNPLTREELKNIEIEISVLSPLQKINSADEIRLGIHGVLVKRGLRTGVFLPQVATETGWSRDEFLSNLCAHKAGLSASAWKDPATEIYIFTAEVFSEKNY